MILDSRDIVDGSVQTCDVCVVGAGAAGIAMALELDAQGRDVLLLEAGGPRRAGPAQDLYRGVVDPPGRHLALDQARYRQLGGTTSLWGGRCIPYDPIDFEPREWVPHSGWPIGRQDLDPYYARAHTYLECGAFDYRAESALGSDAGQMLPGFEDADLDLGSLERWSPPTHFGKVYRDRLARSPRIKVVLRAVVTRLEMAEGGRTVRALTVRDARDASARRGFSVQARQVVLAGGGIESTRLLMQSALEQPIGETVAGGWLGRGYMCHVHGVIARLHLRPGVQPIAGYEQDAAGVFVRRRLWISESAQRRLQLLNLTALLDRPLVDDPGHGSAVLSAAFLAKKLFQRQRDDATPSGKYGIYWQHLRNVLSGSPEVLSVLPRFARSRFLQKRRVPSLTVDPRSGRYHLYYQSEQVPDRSAGLTLLNERDALGQPRVRLDFRVQPQDSDAIWRAHEVIGAAIARQGLGELVWEPDAREKLAETKAVLGHHIGTTRMADHAAQGVVDRHCRVHGVSNLHIASASVLPTSSHANPTLTVVALALRLAARLGSTSSSLSQA